MNRISGNGLVVFALTAVTSLLFLPQRASAQQGRPPTPVTIVAPVPVPVIGSVTVDSSTTSPLAVKDVDRAARETFQMSSVPTSFSNGPGSTSLITVPAGKRLVVEHVSAWINATEASGLLAASLVSGTPQPVVNQLPCGVIGQNALNHIYACGGSTKHYVQAEETLSFSVQTFASAGGFYRVFVSGYYEAVP